MIRADMRAPQKKKRKNKYMDGVICYVLYDIDCMLYAVCYMYMFCDYMLYAMCYMAYAICSMLYLLFCYSPRGIPTTLNGHKGRHVCHTLYVICSMLYVASILLMFFVVCFLLYVIWYRLSAVYIYIYIYLL